MLELHREHIEVRQYSPFSLVVVERFTKQTGTLPDLEEIIPHFPEVKLGTTRPKEKTIRAI